MHGFDISGITSSIFGASVDFRLLEYVKFPCYISPTYLSFPIIICLRYLFPLLLSAGVKSF